MIVGVPCESYPGERRVALVPAIIPNLTKAGLEVVIEAGAGTQAGYLDDDYSAKEGKFSRNALKFLVQRILLCKCFVTVRMTERAMLISHTFVLTKPWWDFCVRSARVKHCTKLRPVE